MDPIEQCAQSNKNVASRPKRGRPEGHEGENEIREHAKDSDTSECSIDDPRQNPLHWW